MSDRHQVTGLARTPPVELLGELAGGPLDDRRLAEERRPDPDEDGTRRQEFTGICTARDSPHPDDRKAGRGERVEDGMEGDRLHRRPREPAPAAAQERP